jgi:aminoglycoside phosphotransferase (APT) family kinase protein
VADAWSPECVVSAEEARTLIEGQFPQLVPAQVELLGVGWDNTVFRVNSSFVFRFPRRRLVVPFFEIETRVLPAIAARLPLPVSAAVCIGRATEAFPWPFAGYPFLPGRTACVATLDAQQREAVAVPLARFLAALHAIPAADAAGYGAGPDVIARLDLGRRLPKLRENLDQMAQRRLVDDLTPFRAILDGAPETYAPRADTLVHGDLYARHLLVDDQDRLAGVIDWGDVHLGDPAVDLAIAHTFLPPSAHAVFRQAYGPINENLWGIARLRGLWHTAMVLIYADSIGDADLLREGLVALHHLR